MHVIECRGVWVRKGEERREWEWERETHFGIKFVVVVIGKTATEEEEEEQRKKKQNISNK